MSSERAGQLRRDRDEPQAVDAAARARPVATSAGRAGARPGRGRRARAGARNGPSRLNPSGSAPSVGRVRQPGPDALGEGDERRRAARVTAVGRNDVTPAAQQRPAMPSSAAAIAHRVVAAPAVDVDVDEPGRDVRAVRRGAASSSVDRRDPPVLDRDPAVRDPVVEDQPTADDVAGPASSPVAGVAPLDARSLEVRALDVELRRRARSGRPGSATRSPRSAGRAPSAMTRRSTSSGSPAAIREQPGVLGGRRGRRDRAGPATQHEPGAARASRGASPWPGRRSSPHPRRRRSGPSTRARSARRPPGAAGAATTTGSPGRDAEAVGLGRRWPGGRPRQEPRARDAPGPAHLLRERHQPVRPAVRRAARPRSCRGPARA